MQQEEDADAGRRYALRARNVRQMKPYAYDQQMYAHQMRRNPDAIVRFARYGRAGGGRRREHYEDEGAEGDAEAGDGMSSDPEVDPAELNLDEEESDGERRRRRRERSVTGEEGRSERPRARARSGTVDEARPGPLTARRQRVATPASEAAASAPVRNVAEDWYRAHMRELDSSGSDDDIDAERRVAGPSKLASRGDEMEKTKKRHRFPMRTPARQKSPSVREQSEASVYLTPDGQQ